MGFNKRYFNSDYVKELAEYGKWGDILEYLSSDALIFSGEDNIEIMNKINWDNKKKIKKSIKSLYKKKNC
jgi:chaperone required for assembly of F1-ATPase